MPGLLWRSMLRKRRRKPGRQRATPIVEGAKYRVKVTMDGMVYEERPDGRRRAGIRA